VSPVKGVYTWHTWPELQMVSSLSTTVQVMTVLVGLNTDYILTSCLA